jgi:arylsulfatase A-like enzyme
VISEITQTIDIMPTILSALNIDIDDSKIRIQGKSLLPLIETSKSSFWGIFMKKKFREYAYCETGGLYGPWPSPSGPNVFCIRTKNWKLIYNKNPNTFELYNLLEDPLELNNSYGLGHSIESKLRKVLKKEMSQMDIKTF